MTGVASMASQVGRLYALAIGVLVLFLSWAAVAAHPWTTPKAGTQVQLLALREQALKRETALVNTILRQRAAAAKQATHPISATSTAQPNVKVVTLPPLTITRTS